MFSNLFWVFAIVGFIAQILCYVYGNNPVVRILPMLALGAVIVCTAVFGSMGLISVALIVVELMLLAVIVLAYILCKLVFFAKK